MVPIGQGMESRTLIAGCPLCQHGKAPSYLNVVNGEGVVRTIHLESFNVVTPEGDQHVWDVPNRLKGKHMFSLAPDEHLFVSTEAFNGNPAIAPNTAFKKCCYNCASQALCGAQPDTDLNGIRPPHLRDFNIPATTRQ